ncbi:MAG: hypothetical protein ACOYL5_18005 [Phototrophicaceae bacterium]|jgi:hypothetical protein
MQKRWLLGLIMIGAAWVTVIPVGAQSWDCNKSRIIETPSINPFTGQVGTFRSTENYIEGDCTRIQDGRVNEFHAAAEAAIYCTDDGIDVYDINISGRGALAFRTTWRELDRIPATPAENTLIEGVPGFALYRLTTGYLQLNGPANWEGKPYVFIWESCPRES